MASGEAGPPLRLRSLRPGTHGREACATRALLVFGAEVEAVTAIPQHSSATNEHYTPADVVDRARRVLGAIDLDPASCPEANAAIKASKIFTRDDDGLRQEWAGRVFLNPPGGLLVRDATGAWVPCAATGPRGGKAKAAQAVWWDKLVAEYARGAADGVRSAIFVGFTLEILRLSQACAAPVQWFSRCYPASRLKFRGASPTHANMIVYLHPQDGTDPFAKFHEAFSTLGLCERGSTI